MKPVRVVDPIGEEITAIPHPGKDRKTELSPLFLENPTINILSRKSGSKFLQVRRIP